MKQKILTGLVLLLFFSFFGYFYGDIYWDFQKQQEEAKYFGTEVNQSLENFSLETLDSLGEDTQLFMTPDLKLLDRIEEQMNRASKNIYVEVYILTEKRMREALIGAHKRGVEVKVLLENNPYQAPSLNDETFEILEEAGVPVRWSDPLNYSLNHAKLLLIDDLGYISTGNFSYSLFKNNRDFLIETQHEKILQTLKELFLLDYEQKLGGVIHENLVLSPQYSREKLELLLHQSQKTIDFYFPYLADENFEKILFKKSAEGVKIRGIVDSLFYEENPEVIEKYKQNNIILTPLKKIKLHAKMILSDETYMYVGSINFSKYSVDENREIGLMIRDTKLISDMQKIFLSDVQ